METISNEQIEIISEFVTEANDLLDELEPAILNLENAAKTDAPISSETIDNLHKIFRFFHSLKGGAGFLQFANIVNVAHSAENLLDSLRNKKIQLLSHHVDLLCQACDFMKNSLDYVLNHHEDLGVIGEAKALQNDLKDALTASEDSADLPVLTAASDQSPSHPTATKPEQPQAGAHINLDLSPEQLINPETITHFLSEANDLFQEMEADLLQWLKSPEDMPQIERLYRNVHSFKGNCGFLNYADLEKLSHRAESALDAVKNGETAQNEKIAEVLLQVLDVFKGTAEQIAKSNQASVCNLHLYLDLLDEVLPASRKELHHVSSGESLKLGEILVEQGVLNEDDVEKALLVQQRPIGEILAETGLVSQQQIEKALVEQKKRKAQFTPDRGGNSGEAGAIKRQDIRVDLEKLDNLITLIGEMVIAQNMVINNPELEGLPLENFNKAGQHMVKIVRELQEMAMVIRMIPVAGLFKRMIRLVHDLSRKSGKKVELVLEGETTEVDKTVIEKITDPLVHLIRNSMDHGVEDPADRLQSGKPETGTITLSATHQEGDVLIKIIDDGRGLNREKILRKASEKGLVEGDGSQLTEKEIANLIFLPGFSTAEAITDISGRGVGMDVVRQNLESIKGKIEVSSKAGQGTSIVLRIPLTLAIIEGMLVRTGKSLYIIPILSICESFRPTRQNITVSPDGQELVKVREHLYPVVRLHQLHSLEPDHYELEKGILIVIEVEGHYFCLFVDELLGQQQTVIKALSDYITQTSPVRGVSGCTILGNGDVCLIIDVRSLGGTV